MSSVQSIESQRSQIFALLSAGWSGARIAEHLQNLHGDNSLKKTAIYSWIERFKDGQATVSDLPRPGRPESSSNKKLRQQIETLLDSDARCTVRQIADILGSPKTTIHRVMSEEMGLSKISARWVPRLLTPDLKARRLDMATSNLRLVQEHGGWSYVSSLIISGDETWIPFFDPETKEESRVWAMKGSQPPVKARRDQHSKKVMMTLLFDRCGPLTIDFLEEGATINADRYSATVQKLKTDVQNKRRSGEKPYILHHDNARPHTAKSTVEVIERANFELLPHPPYSPDLAPADFAIFPKMKKLLRGRIFANRGDLEALTRHVLVHEMPRSDFASAIDDMHSRWLKCVQLSGDYVEKPQVKVDK